MPLFKVPVVFDCGPFYFFNVEYLVQLHLLVGLPLFSIMLRQIFLRVLPYILLPAFVLLSRTAKFLTNVVWLDLTSNVLGTLFEVHYGGVAIWGGLHLS